MRTISHSPHYKNDAACDVTNKTYKMMRKESINGSHVIYVVLYIKISVKILLRKPSIPNIWCSVFNSLECISPIVTHIAIIINHATNISHYAMKPRRESGTQEHVAELMPRQACPCYRFLQHFGGDANNISGCLCGHLYQMPPSYSRHLFGHTRNKPKFFLCILLRSSLR